MSLLEEEYQLFRDLAANGGRSEALSDEDDRLDYLRGLGFLSCGMSESVGPMFLGGQEEVFIAKDWGHTRNYSESLAATVDDEVRRILDTQYDRAKAAISDDLAALDRVAQMLIEYERVTGEEFGQVYRGADAAEVLGKRKKPAEPAADKPAAPAAPLRPAPAAE